MLARKVDRMRSLPGEACVIDNPYCQRKLPGYGLQYLSTYLLQKCLIAPLRIGHNVMQRLVHLSHMTGCKPCCHRLHALALKWKHQALM